MRLFTCTVLLLFSALAGPSARAQDTGTVLESVSVEGLRRVEVDAALSGVRSKKGQPFETSVVTEDLRRMWRSGFFEDIRAETSSDADGLKLVFVVREKPSIRKIAYVGHDDVSTDDIKGVVDLKAFTILNVDSLKRNAKKIKDLYVEKGFYLADINYRIRRIDGRPYKIDVVFEIEENAKVQVRQVSFVGVEALKPDSLREVMLTREGTEFSWITGSGTFKEDFLQADVFRIQGVYFDQGYVEAKIGQPEATITPDRRYVYVSVPVTEGLQYDIGDLTFSGDIQLRDEKSGELVVDEARLREKLTIVSTETFNRTKLLADLQAVTDVYRDQGYAYANVTPNTRLRREEQIIDLEFGVERGDLVHIDRIEITGNTRTRDKVIRRELQIAEGEKFSATGIAQSRARVFQLGFFETVNITTNRGSAPDLVDLTIEIKERSTGTFQVGAGFSSVENFIATAQISQNNFLGKGQSLSLSAQLSFGNFARQLATLQFFEPYFLDTLWSFGFDAFITQRFFINQFQRNANGGSFRFGYPITPELRVSAGYTLEDIEIVVDPDRQFQLASLNQDGFNSALSFFIAYDTRNNRLFPSSGQYHLLSAEISDQAIFSDLGFEYRKFELTSRYYHPLPLGLVFRFNANLGIIFGKGDREAPISERFFPGGIFSVRGFAPRRLGPFLQVPSGNDPAAETAEFAKGGNKQTIFNFEIEFPIIQQAGIKGVIFADAGNAFDDDDNFFFAGQPRSQQPDAFLIGSGKRIKPPLGLFYSFGFGFRWFSPIGPLRFEWGVPITKRRSTDDDVLFEFTIGNFF